MFDKLKKMDSLSRRNLIGLLLFGGLYIILSIVWSEELHEEDKNLGNVVYYQTYNENIILDNEDENLIYEE